MESQLDSGCETFMESIDGWLEFVPDERHRRSLHEVFESAYQTVKEEYAKVEALGSEAERLKQSYEHQLQELDTEREAVRNEKANLQTLAEGLSTQFGALASQVASLSEDVKASESTSAETLRATNEAVSASKDMQHEAAHLENNLVARFESVSASVNVLAEALKNVQSETHLQPLRDETRAISESVASLPSAADIGAEYNRQLTKDYTQNLLALRRERNAQRGQAQRLREENQQLRDEIVGIDRQFQEAEASRQAAINETQIGRDCVGRKDVRIQGLLVSLCTSCTRLVQVEQELATAQESLIQANSLTQETVATLERSRDKAARCEQRRVEVESDNERVRNELRDSNSQLDLKTCLVESLTTQLSEATSKTEACNALLEAHPVLSCSDEEINSIAQLYLELADEFGDLPSFIERNNDLLAIVIKIVPLIDVVNAKVTMLSFLNARSYGWHCLHKVAEEETESLCSHDGCQHHRDCVIVRVTGRDSPVLELMLNTQ
ncbi:hypothetical protein FLONG3_4908 [Fusarium longipes]|uniref:Uncharacterized protein n=1 Tax=Fusarium longipes TaxID=694270 RepID=A0A395SWX6_9HYPO|nr:hypothetical protein FLONG3_4908 [Fusarium longipes]